MPVTTHRVVDRDDDVDSNLARVVVQQTDRDVSEAVAEGGRALDGNEEMRTFDVSLDGKSIIFDRLSKNADVVLIELDPSKD